MCDSGRRQSTTLQKQDREGKPWWPAKSVMVAKGFSRARSGIGRWMSTALVFFIGRLHEGRANDSSFARVLRVFYQRPVLE